jgi:cell division transport system permease protein
VLREVGRNLRASPWLTLVAILTIAVSLVMVGLFGLVLANSNRVIEGLAKELSVTAYLVPNATEADIDALVKELARLEEVESVRYVTATEDRDRNRELLGPTLLAGLEDALPGQHAVEVRLKAAGFGKDDLARLAELLSALKAVDLVDAVPFDASEVRLLVAILDLVRVTGFIVSASLLAAALFFSFSTIKLGVLARAHEIEVLRLVGASDGFIAAPFYVEGTLVGLGGSVLALALVRFIHGRLQSYASEEHLLRLDLKLMPPGMLLWLLVGGTLVAGLAAALSVRRHLRT